MRSSTRLALLLVACFASGGTRAQGLAANEFRRVGSGFTCVTVTKDFESGYLPCLRIGPLYVGQREKDIEKLVGKPWKAIRQDAATVIKVYSIASKETEKPYWVITFTRGVAATVQVTGRNPGVEYPFSSIKLGDPKEKVLQVLGEPMASAPIDQSRGTVWAYPPWPFSVELVDDLVYSIRVTSPQQTTTAPPPASR
ncbi:MAG: hypothetical protein ACJ8DQ_06180 [Xanthobacteraceae bacterium]